MNPDPACTDAPSNLVIAENAPAALPNDEPPLDEVVDTINRLYIAGGLQVALSIGRYLIDTFFGGDPQVFRDVGRKATSFRKLAARDDLRVSHSFLWYACSIVGQLDEIPQEVREALPISHHRALLPLRDAEAKAVLARRIVDEDLSRREVEGEVRRLREAAGQVSRGGRPPLPAVVKVVNRIAAAVRAGGESAVDSLDPTQARELVMEVDQQIAALTALRERFAEVAGEG